jgi:hypothetical protein
MVPLKAAPLQSLQAFGDPVASHVAATQAPSGCRWRPRGRPDALRDYPPVRDDLPVPAARPPAERRHNIV